ncbi:MAG: acyltransferase domain-containing protein, partial [Anaerolineales bacterium]|nr:acyltransferase domain-containing protein [Anaerolineales bacterium]
AADGAADKRMAGAAARLQQTDMTQPALFVMEYALAQLYLAWGIRPQAMIGHSIGEYAAACLAGVFTLEEALALVAARGRLMQQMPPGSMLVVPLPEAAVRPYLTAGLSVAVINGPEYSVISGPDEAIDDLQARLAADDVNGRRLHTSHAFHSSMMAGAVDPFAAQAARVRLQPPQIPFLSNVSGTWITDDEATDPNYWARHIRETVRFGAGLDVLLTDPATVLLEVGPGQVLSSLAEQHPARLPQQVILSSIRHPRQARDDVDFLLTTLGRLWLAGVRPDWAALHGDAARRRVPLPTYPFERQRYWIAPRRVKLAQAAAAAEPVKKKELADWLYAPAWRETAVPALDEARLVAQARRWLLFVDERGVGAALAARLRTLGQDVVTVRAGAAYAPADGAAFVLPPDDRAAYDALFGALAEADRLPDQVIHLWGVDGGAESAAEALVARGFYSLLYLAQAIGRTGRTAPLGLLVVTDGMQAVAEEERPLPEKATILGPCRVIPQEFPFVTCRSVDLAADTADTADGLRQAQPPAFVARLLAEAATDEAADRADAVVAYRGGVRYVQGFETWPAAGLRQAQPAEGGVALREGGVYLITGGLGGVGLALAAHLAARARARLVLLSRSGLPAREAWAARLVDGGADDGTSQKIRQVQALEALGAEVLVLAA